ncbi:type II toxin-antitoxin system RelE/ParE family toxin [Algoriphagus yeomjeoni]|uniref:RelE toxin of RelEB toxin-antitoxin system n=1 Tax=Algoriphagus yeomjeoni TaxID=291403 RepID=A0A327PJ05_9BACT|nr:type II toxin-antitoxin system RelE/ParE family toxin [Algoriphagus yeomjeoni]RAI92259.1 RelE toxin of RelEB toxin-antitoxin system [Algoriphagus yeomjeoni]
MSFEILATDIFERSLKKIAKKHRSIKEDLKLLAAQLLENPRLGKPLGKDCYKIRLVISSKGKGKSGGARIITFLKVTKSQIYLLDIYDKSEKSSLSDKELKLLISQISIK